MDSSCFANLASIRNVASVKCGFEMQPYQLNWGSTVVSLKEERDKIPSLKYLPSGERGTCIYDNRRRQHVILTKVATVPE